VISLYVNFLSAATSIFHPSFLNHAVSDSLFRADQFASKKWSLEAFRSDVGKKRSMLRTIWNGDGEDPHGSRRGFEILVFYP
jgi:hypothetical protein